MAEGRRAHLAWAVLALGFCLAWLPLAVRSPLASLGLALAQPLLVLAWSRLRGSRELQRPKFPLARDLGALLFLWLPAFALLALAIAWPLDALRESGALKPALVLSFCVGCVLLGLWRLSPAFAQAARRGQSIGALIGAATQSQRSGASPGLAIALAVFAVLALGIALAWPALIPDAVRPWLLLAFPLLSLLLHAGVHRLAAVSIASALEAAGPTPTATDSLPSPSETETDGDSDAISVDERLYAALRAGRVDAALRALADGGDARAMPDESEQGGNTGCDQRTLAMLAALQSDLRALRELIGRGIDLNLKHGDLTPLLAATRDSWHGRPEAVMMLLANGADARVADGEGNTPLHHAARSTDPAVAALLLDAGAHIDAINAEGFSALGAACQAGNWRVARFLIEHGARPEPVDGQPVLLAAASGEDDPAGVQLLLRHKARIDARGFGQRTALLQACAIGNIDVVGALLEAGADRNARDSHGLTPLLEAAGNAHGQVIARLALAKPDPSAVDAEQRNALILACLANAPPELLRDLIAIGVQLDQADGQGRRAIEIAVENGRWPQVAILDPTHALPMTLLDGPIEEAATPPRQRLREALAARDWPSAQAVLKRDDALPPSLLSELLLECAVAEDWLAFEWLCRHGANADLPLESGQDSVLFRLFDLGGAALPGLAYLLERGQSAGGTGGLSRLLGACLQGEHASRGHEQLALTLLERGADVFGTHSPSEPALILAIRLGWQRLVEALLAHGADPNVRGAHGHRAVHIAATLGRETALRALIRYGALPQAQAPDGQTALGVALATGRNDLSHWLEWRGWPLPGRALRPSDLPAAAVAGDAEAVCRLIELGLPVDSVDRQGCSALLHAAGGGHERIVQALIDRGADHGLSALAGATPLSAAISKRHIGVVDRLLRAGADPNQALPGGVTPLMLAAALGLPDIASRLLSGGAVAETRDERGLDALHCAASYAFAARDRQRVLALIDLLLLADLSLDRADAGGHTPLLLMLGARADAATVCDEQVLLAALERLLQAGVSLDDQDRRGLSALHLAALRGLLGVVQRLLREGADRLLRDCLGRSAHELALLRGYADIAAEFEPTRGPPSLARFLRDPH